MTFDIQEIMGLLPHRYPFLLIDKVVEFEPQKRLVAIKNVTINEPFFQGHFPGHPIMPGVLVIEAMAQAGGIIMMHELPDRDEKLVVFTGVGIAMSDVFRRVMQALEPERNYWPIWWLMLVAAIGAELFYKFDLFQFTAL